MLDCLLIQKTQQIDKMMTIRKNVKKKAKKIEKKTCINNSNTLTIDQLCNLKELEILVVHLVFKPILSDSN